jgi:hypothetical protein
MKTVLRRAFTAVLIALGAQQALAQPVNGCPAGYAMQSSDPSGRRVTCVQITETDIIGRWAVTGTTKCLQATGGFSTQSFSPLISTAPTSVSQLAGTFIGTRTFYAGGTGHSVGTSHTLTFPATVYSTGAPPVGGGTGGASVATLDASFTWSIQSNGMLLIDDDNSIAQPFTAPPSLLGQTVTIENVPSFAGYISKDMRTIELTHPGMSLETSIRRNASGVEQSRTPRYCARSRVLTRLP